VFCVSDAQKFVVLGGLVVSVFTIGLKVRRFKPGQGRYESVARIIRRGIEAVGPHIVRFHDMLKNPSMYERDTS
jgi:hypothetical protein